LKLPGAMGIPDSDTLKCAAVSEGCGAARPELAVSRGRKRFCFIRMRVASARIGPETLRTNQNHAGDRLVVNALHVPTQIDGLGGCGQFGIAIPTAAFARAADGLECLVDVHVNLGGLFLGSQFNLPPPSAYFQQAAAFPILLHPASDRKITDRFTLCPPAPVHVELQKARRIAVIMGQGVAIRLTCGVMLRLRTPTR
jgi:hypothetical protein